MVDWIGKTLFCEECGMEVKIVKPNNPSWGSGPSLVCCGEEMKVKTHEYREGQDKTFTGNETGKVYKCLICGREIEITRGGEGTLYCCGQPMGLKD